MTTVGIIGAGQLGQMLGYAANSLGLDCIFLDPSDNPPAASAGRVIKAAYDDTAALRELAETADVVTYEFENVPVAAARSVSACPVFPPPAALEKAQDRISEKTLFEALSIPVPGFRQIDQLSDVHAAIESLGLPLVIKTRRLGYDGKGQAILNQADDAADILESLGQTGLIAEQFVPFTSEVSIIGTRDTAGKMVFYPMAENRHEQGILRVSRAPADIGGLAEDAVAYLERLLEQLEYVGTLALELFVTETGLLANEMAPRVHNSGHWTIEGTTASQFENHIRAVTGMPLVKPELVGFPAMINVIGQMPEDTASIRAAGAVLHDYGKSPRPGRKLAHITVVGGSETERDREIGLVETILAGKG